MKKLITVLICFGILTVLISGCRDVPANSESNISDTSADTSSITSSQEEPGGDKLDIGIGRVNITPDEDVYIFGGPVSDLSEGVDHDLFIKAMVISDGVEKVAIITMDTCKYPLSNAEGDMAAIEEATGISADKITITSSHTHSAPFFTYYKDSLRNYMVEAVSNAVEDLEPCVIGAANVEVKGAAYNRRLMYEGEAWNAWLIKSAQARFIYPACGPIDTDLQMLAVIGEDDQYKAVLWNFASHANASSSGMLSSDYPGFVEEYLGEELGYEVSALFMPGACGDLNPTNTVRQIGVVIGDGILSGLEELEILEDTSLTFKTEIIDMPGREDPVFAEEEIAAKWPDQLESYRGAFDNTLASAPDSYKTYICAISIGNDFAIITDPGELFCSIGLNIKEASPFKYTLVTEQTNGALGYIPAEKDFELKGYETWYGEHSNLSVTAGTKIQETSIELLDQIAQESGK